MHILADVRNNNTCYLQAKVNTILKEAEKSKLMVVKKLQALLNLCHIYIKYIQ